MRRPVVVVVWGMMFLASCGGGGGSSGAPPLPPGFGPGTEARGEQASREAAITARTDYLGFTRIRGQVNALAPDPVPIDPITGLPPITDPVVDLPDPVEFTYEVLCDTANVCSPVFSPPSTAGSAGGVRTEYGVPDIQWITRNSQVILAHQESGINIIESRSTNLHPTVESPDMLSWGAWLNHSGFVVRSARSLRDDDGGELRFETLWHYAMVGGDLTGTRPTRPGGETTGSITWRGAMVGTPEQSLRRLTGEARIVYDVGTQLMDATFTNITEEPRTIMFHGVPVDQLGRFDDGTGGNYIRGGFFGPNHAETAGVFEQLGIIGAFGATRESGQ